MSFPVKTAIACLAAAFALLPATPVSAQTANTTFFLTSNGVGNGGNLGGLAGADNHCQTLAQAAGFGAPRRGTPISRPRPPTARPRRTRATASARVPGKM